MAYPTTKIVDLLSYKIFCNKFYNIVRYVIKFIFLIKQVIYPMYIFSL